MVTQGNADSRKGYTLDDPLRHTRGALESFGKMDGSQAVVVEEFEYNQCQEAVKRLNDYLSKELGPDEEALVERHLSQCKGCFAKFHFEETLLRAIRERVAHVRAPQALREKILSLLRPHAE